MRQTARAEGTGATGWAHLRDGARGGGHVDGPAVAEHADQVRQRAHMVQVIVRDEDSVDAVGVRRGLLAGRRGGGATSRLGAHTQAASITVRQATTISTAPAAGASRAARDVTVEKQFEPREAALVGVSRVNATVEQHAVAAQLDQHARAANLLPPAESDGLDFGRRRHAAKGRADSFT